jgi:hypothetical protein
MEYSNFISIIFSSKKPQVAAIKQLETRSTRLNRRQNHTQDTKVDHIERKKIILLFSIEDLAKLGRSRFSVNRMNAN